MNLRKLLEVLYNLDKDTVIENGFHNPHSYRGYYEELAVEPKDNCKVSELIDILEEAYDNTYRGYKGGDYTMHGDCRVFIAYEGSCGVLIEGVLINENGYSLQTTGGYY